MIAERLHQDRLGCVVYQSPRHHQQLPHHVTASNGPTCVYYAVRRVYRVVWLDEACGSVRCRCVFNFLDLHTGELR